jgi:arylsulfatase
MTMNRTLMLLLIVSGVLLSAVTTHAQSGKPNILVIWGDDIGGFNLSTYNQGMMGYNPTATPIFDMSTGTP